MRYVVLAPLCILLSFQARAQTEQENWLLGAGTDLGFLFGKIDSGREDTYTSFGLEGRAGYFLVDNLVVGLDLGFNSYSVGSYSESTLALGPFARYYFKMRLFAEAGYQFGAVTADGNDRGNTSSFGLGAGYAAFIHEHFAIEPMLQYSLTSIKWDEGSAVQGYSFGLMVNFSLYLGG